MHQNNNQIKSDGPANITFVGVDVAQTKLDVFFTQGDKKQYFTVNNTTAGIKSMLARVAKAGITPHYVSEHTGHYGELFVQALEEHNLRQSIVNPRQVRNFARCLGHENKTDGIDAQVLTEFGAARPLRLHVAPSALQRRLHQLHTALDFLISQRADATNAWRGAKAHPETQAIFGKTLEALTGQIDVLLQKLVELIKADDTLGRVFDTLVAIKSIGAKTAVALIVLMPELGKLGRKKIGALAGLAPQDWQSGKMKAPSSIRGGRKALRNHIYMAAVVACRCNPFLKVIYQRLVDKGKPKKVAIIAVARRLLCFANSSAAKLFAHNPA